MALGRNNPFAPIGRGAQLAGHASGSRGLRAVLKRVSLFLLNGPHASAFPPPDVARIDASDVYLQACLTAPHFCYVSPSLYGLAGIFHEPSITRRNLRRGDEA